MARPADPPSPAPTWISVWASHPALQQVARELLGVAAPTILTGFPRVGSEPGASAHASFALGPARGGPGVSVRLPHHGVRALAERMLGGPGSLSEVHGAGPPLPAELGVLAYLFARLIAAASSGWVLRGLDVGGSAEPDAVRWPLALTCELGTLAVELCASPGTIATGPLMAELVWGDDEPLPTELAVGDLVLASGAPLTWLDTGLCGELSLRVHGLSGELAVRAADGRARATAGRASRARATELVMTKRALDEEALLALARHGIAWPLVGPEPVRVLRHGVDAAEGELVVLRGELGVRLTRV